MTHCPRTAVADGIESPYCALTLKKKKNNSIYLQCVQRSGGFPEATAQWLGLPGSVYDRAMTLKPGSSGLEGQKLLKKNKKTRSPTSTWWLRKCCSPTEKPVFTSVYFILELKWSDSKHMQKYKQGLYYCNRHVRPSFFFFVLIQVALDKFCLCYSFCSTVWTLVSKS